MITADSDLLEFDRRFIDRLEQDECGICRKVNCTCDEDTEELREHIRELDCED